MTSPTYRLKRPINNLPPPRSSPHTVPSTRIKISRKSNALNISGSAPEFGGAGIPSLPACTCPLITFHFHRLIRRKLIAEVQSYFWTSTCWLASLCFGGRHPDASGDRLRQRPICDQAPDRLDIWIHNSIVFQKWHMPAHQFVGDARPPAQLGCRPQPLTPEVDALGRRHQLQGQDALQVVQDLASLAGGGAAHADVVLRS